MGLLISVKFIRFCRGNSFLRNVKTMVRIVTNFIATQIQSTNESFGSVN